MLILLECILSEQSLVLFLLQFAFKLARYCCSAVGDLSCDRWEVHSHLFGTEFGFVSPEVKSGTESKARCPFDTS